MLLTTIQESDPLYQFCEECISNYYDTLDESYIASFCEMSDEEAHKIINPPDGVFDNDLHAKLFTDDIKNLNKISWNPFKVRKFIKDNLGDMPSRAQGIGVHQPQNKLIQHQAFWSHPTTVAAQTGIIVAPALYALKKVHDYENKPIGLIARKIASLRKALAKIKSYLTGSKLSQLKAKLGNDKFAKAKSRLQEVAGKVADAIDKLLKIAQRKSSIVSRELNR